MIGTLHPELEETLHGVPGTRTVENILAVGAPAVDVTHEAGSYVTVVKVVPLDPVL
jgi:hypothetical protein